MLEAVNMSSVTEFYRCQIGGTSIINYSYTDFPLKLLAKDVYYFFFYSWALPYILWPMFAYGSGDLDELYPTWRNMFGCTMQITLAVVQLMFLLALPFTILFPVWLSTAAVGGFLTVNWLVCCVLNGSEQSLVSDEKYAQELPEHAHEEWVFINGVATG